MEELMLHTLWESKEKIYIYEFYTFELRKLESLIIKLFDLSKKESFLQVENIIICPNVCKVY